MPKLIPDKIATELKRLPVEWLPKAMEPRSVKEDRLAALEKIKRSFQGSLNAFESRSMGIVQKKIDQILHPGLAERIIRTAARILSFGAAPFYPVNANQRGYESVIRDRGVTRLLDDNKPILKWVTRDLRNRGVNGSIGNEELADILSKQKSFETTQSTHVGKNTLDQKYTYVRSDETGRYAPSKIYSTLKKEVRINEENVNGVNIPDLERRMKNIDWRVDYFSRSATASGNPEENKRILNQVGDITSDLLKIRTGNSPESQKVHDQLAYKYFSDTPNSKVLGNEDSMKALYEVKVKNDVSQVGSPSFSPKEIANMIEGRPVQDPRSNGKPGTWYQIDPGKKDSQGFYELKPIPDSEKVDMNAALLKAGVQSLRSPEGEDAKKMLRRGEQVEATILQNGVPVSRVISMDVGNNSVIVDNKESVNRNLVSARGEEGHSKILDYLHGISNIQKNGQPEAVRTNAFVTQPSVAEIVQRNENNQNASQVQAPEKREIPENAAMLEKRINQMWDELTGGISVDEERKIQMTR